MGLPTFEKKTHGYLIEKAEPPKCENCDKKLTIKHIKGESPKYNLIRKQKMLITIFIYRYMMPINQMTDSSTSYLLPKKPSVK